MMISDRVGPPLETLPTPALLRVPSLSSLATALTRSAGCPAAGTPPEPDRELIPIEIALPFANCEPDGAVIFKEEVLCPRLPKALAVPDRSDIL